MFDYSEMVKTWLKIHKITICSPGARTEGFEDQYLLNPFHADYTDEVSLKLTAIPKEDRYMASRPEYDAADDWVPPAIAKKRGKKLHEADS